MRLAQAQLDGVFEALADATRRSILDRLRIGPLTVTVLAEPYVMSLNAVSKHLKKLESAGLIRRSPLSRDNVRIATPAFEAQRRSQGPGAGRPAAL